MRWQHSRTQQTYTRANTIDSVHVCNTDPADDRGGRERVEEKRKKNVRVGGGMFALAAVGCGTPHLTLLH